MHVFLMGIRDNPLPDLSGCDPIPVGGELAPPLYKMVIPVGSADFTLMCMWGPLISGCPMAQPEVCESSAEFGGSFTIP